ncbi:Bug family tripartite tricarboxylate transporter substrate binding protein [Paenibacillus hamazuiensis]|uniref:Bug family tripartite tricarboxylate transporter substrate binding protein n=1 Tax=Paenibacillus hamazuiensis TaxID=2936508 RepID=UPI00200C7895|nr:tripartite tricarboxylate transporter substrate binding protein [Paenibacillus hamazuiensis]
MTINCKKWTTIMLTSVLAVGLAACSAEQQAPAADKKEGAMATAGQKATASGYPEKPVTIMAPSGAGGGLDLTSRALVKALGGAKLVPQTMSVENKPGGGQAVGLAEFVTQDKKNSYKLFLPSPPLIINNLKKEGNSPYSFRDLTPLAQLTKDYGAIVVKADSKYNDLKTLMADLKANPKSLTLAGGSAPGSQDHLIAMLPAVKAGVDAKAIKFVSFDGGGEAMTSLLGGNADVLSTDISGVTEYLKSGKVKVLGVSAPSRLSGQFKDIPTYKEQGIDAEFTIWRGLFGSKEMSAEAVKYWDEKLKTLSETPEWKKELENNGWENGYKNAADFQKFLEEQEKLIKDVLGALGMLK